MKLSYFKDIDFLQAIKALFNELKVPMNYVADEPTTAKEILKDTYKENATFTLVEDVYFVGMVDDAAFEQNESLAVEKIKSDYDGVLIFGITLHPRENNLLPTRSQLAEISRAFNREFYYTPVVLVFKYKDDTADYIAFANTERLKYKQAWREGEKAGKVSLLRDINIANPHSGHERIIFGDGKDKGLRINDKIDSFAKLYTYWQEVFNVNVLNKKFYQELSNWYFWAVKHVTFPNMPTMNDVQEKFGVIEQQKLDDLIQEHNAKNVIRMLTRLLFTWFIKEKKLIPEDLFNLDSLQQDILKEISPYHEVGTMFTDANKDSVYYKAILQNLFFASLNCPIDADRLDNRTRGFRGLETYGKHRGIDWMMRYKNHFKNPDKFLKMMNQTVPFLNGGLFECLDDKTQNLYIDGFSDQMTKGEKLVVPDYLFFGVEEKIDLSNDYGVKNKGAKEAAVKGLINILKSYKFTITENTPIEEDVALDPELLGKVFENLLASYNPETKTTARKQTGSFYTPREIVNYMVDESLIAYLKNNVENFDIESEQLDQDLHQLFSFDNKNPFEDNEALQKQIIKALDKCTILDPACGSGAFPMGALQKMVHVLHKVDPNGQEWKQRQIDKVNNAIESLEEIEDSQIREQSIKDLELQKQDIEDAFENNELDYGRKLFLIENCIYGVDIQSIATQISKLRFFISLVVDQKIDPNKENFGIRPLPNLETKFVAANTLIGIDKDGGLFETDKVKALEKELKTVRHKLFSLKSKKQKNIWRNKDEELRTELSYLLKEQGLPLNSAEKLAGWNPYDQNASSSFFDPEWMFDIKEGFDVVIGNPPYITPALGKKQNIFTDEYINVLKELYKDVFEYKGNTYAFFIRKGIELAKVKGNINYIIPNTLLLSSTFSKSRSYLLGNTCINLLMDFKRSVFDEAETGGNLILIGTKNNKSNSCSNLKSVEFQYYSDFFNDWNYIFLNQNDFNEKGSHKFYLNPTTSKILNSIKSNHESLGNIVKFYQGIITGDNKRFLSNNKVDNSYRKILRGKDISAYKYNFSENYILFDKNLLWSNTNEDFFLTDEKLINRQTGDKLVAAIDNKQYFTLDSTHVQVLINNDFSLKYILPIFNSTLLNYYYSLLVNEGGRTFAQVKTVNLKPLPIPLSDKQEIIVFLVNLILFNAEKLDATNTNVFFMSFIDSLIYELYFPEHMQEKEIDVLPFVEKDIAAVMQGSVFGKLNDTEKEEVIEQLHQTWSHPDNEVRNRIKLFAVRSPDILKPILES